MEDQAALVVVACQHQQTLVICAGPPSARPCPASLKASERASTTFADVFAFDGNASVDELPTRHRAFGHDCRRVVLGGVKGEIAGDVHVHLPFAQHAPA